MATLAPQTYSFPEPMTQAAPPPGLQRPLPEPPMKARVGRQVGASPSAPSPPPGGPSAPSPSLEAPPPPVPSFRERVLAKYIQPMR